jgi:hypothetical protein
MLGHCYCQELDPMDWHEKEQGWSEGRYFYLVTTRMALHSPLTYNEDISRAMMEAKCKGYLIKPGGLILLKSGLFRGEIFIEINPPREDVVQNDTTKSTRKLEGKFYSVVTALPLSQMGKMVEKLNHDLKKKGKQAQDFYLCLVVCPQCTREKGNQSVVLVHIK